MSNYSLDKNKIVNISVEELRSYQRVKSVNGQTGDVEITAKSLEAAKESDLAAERERAQSAESTNAAAIARAAKAADLATEKARAEAEEADIREKFRQKFEELNDLLNQESDRATGKESSLESEIMEAKGYAYQITLDERLRALAAEKDLQDKIDAIDVPDPEEIDVPEKLSELEDDLGSSPVHTHSQYMTQEALNGYATKEQFAGYNQDISDLNEAVFGEEGHVQSQIDELKEKLESDIEELKESLIAVETAVDELGLYIKDGQIYEKWEEIR